MFIHAGEGGGSEGVIELEVEFEREREFESEIGRESGEE
jgi:hypothetical protein